MEATKIYYNAVSLIESMNEELGKLFDEQEEFKDMIHLVKSVKYNNFNLLIQKNFVGDVMIEVKTLARILSSWRDVNGNLQYGADITRLIKSIENGIIAYTVSPYKAENGKIVSGYFFYIYDLPFVLGKYADKLIRFMAKTFEDGDEEGCIYFNAVKNKYGDIVKVKVGRTSNNKHRLEVYNSDAKKNGEIIETVDKIEVSKIRKFENYWKNYIEDDIIDDMKVTKSGEYFILSEIKEERIHQYKSLFNLWASFKISIMLNFENQT